MAGLAAVNQVGESIVSLLRSRRDLLAAEGRLGPVPAALDISHVSLSRLATQPPPAAGCTLSCYRIAMSDHPAQRSSPRDAAAATSLSVELHYLFAAWSPAVADEQAIISWAMLELLSHPILDRSVLPNNGDWGRGETVQIVPETLSDDALFRLWGALQIKYHLSATFRARVIRIDYGPAEEWLPVVASRFGYADTDPLKREPV